jgi:hypothetical protein
MFARLLSWFGLGSPGRRVLWTSRALSRFGPEQFPATLPQKQIDALLLATFPQGDIVVLETMVGFRRRANLLILLVEEVCQASGAGGTYVVKVGQGAPLLAEWRGYVAAFPRVFAGDQILMKLTQGHPNHDRPNAEFRSIVYGNARSWIGEDDHTSLARFESVALAAIRFGCPNVEGVGAIESVVLNLFDRLSHHLYQHGSCQRLIDIFDAMQTQGTTASLEQLPNLGRFREALDEWDTQPGLRNVRAYIDRTIQRMDTSDPDNPVRRYLGVIPFLCVLLEMLAKASAHRSKQQPDGSPSAAESRCPFPPRLQDLNLPVLVGPSHGDLHGRNVLVGVIEERADIRRLGFPAVFDYGNMGPKNLIALDFVKLETELKVRAYELVFDYEERDDFTRSVHDFEWRLACDTMEFAQHRGWPEYESTNEREVRLRQVLVAIRKQAIECLSLRASRSRTETLDEFWLFMCAYSVLPCFFDDYRSREHYQIAVAISGGVAAACLSWVRHRLTEEYRAVHRLAVAKLEVVATEMERWFRCGLIGYDALIDLLKRWWESGDPERRKVATTHSDKLAELFPLAQDVWRWHIQLHLETAPGSVPDLVRRAEERFPDPSEEILCRFGRARRELGDKFRTATRPNLPRAQEQYEKAITQYERAYAIRAGHYPGVNIAALYLFVAVTYSAENPDRAAAIRMANDFAEKVRTTRPWPVDNSDDKRIWHPATEADLLLLRRAWDKAADAYRALRPTEGEKGSIGGQIKRIVDAWKALGETVPEPFLSFDPKYPNTIFSD